MDINLKIADINSKLSSTASEDKLYPYVLFKVSNNLYGMNCRYIISIEKYMKIIETINQPGDLRGVSEYKEEVINLIDMRSVFNLPSQRNEIHEITDINRYIDDHKRNADILYENAVAHKVTNMTPDPTQCPFGKWFGDFKKKGIVNEHRLSEIDRSHSLMHAQAVEIDKLVMDGNYEKAIELAKIVRHNSHTSLEENLGSIEKVILDHIQELVIILGREGKKCGIIIDSVEGVEDINEIQPLPQGTQFSKYLINMGLRKKTNDIILLLEHSAFF